VHWRHLRKVRTRDTPSTDVERCNLRKQPSMSRRKLMSMGLVHSAATYMAFLGTRMALGTEDKTQLGTLIESPLLSGSYYSGNGPFGVQTFQEMIRCKIDPPPLPKRHHFSRGGSSEKAVGGGGGDIVHHIWTRVMLNLPQRKSMHPAMRGHKFPVVVIAPGFLLKATQYQTYAKKLASFGYVVVCYDIPSETIGRTLDDVNHYRLIPQILNFIEKNNQGFSGSFRRKITPFHTSCNTNDDTARGGGECLDSGRRKVVVPKPNHVDAAIMPLGTSTRKKMTTIKALNVLPMTCLFDGVEISSIIIILVVIAVVMRTHTPLLTCGEKAHYSSLLYV